MAAQLYKTESGRLWHAGAIAIITVGLPARGKTHTSRSLSRYLRWLGVQTEVFHVGNYRRQDVRRDLSFDFFDPANESTRELRRVIADKALDDLIQFLRGGGQVGIYDASNTTEERRARINERLEKEGVHVLFIESICDKDEIVEQNIRAVKISHPDYVSWDREQALQDFKRRINNHIPYYETLSNTALSWVKMINVGERMIINNVTGFLPTRIVFYLMNLHITPRTIYFARNGQSTNEHSDKKDAELSKEGKRHAQLLESFLVNMRSCRKENSEEWPAATKRLNVWTSARRRSYGTAQYFQNLPNTSVRQRPILREINMGEFDEMTRAEIKEQHPDEWERHLKDPYRHRYPCAESYHDLAVRLEPVILELEREKSDVLIIAHRSVLRCLYAYIFGLPERDIPDITIPRNCIVEITPGAYTYKERRWMIPEEE